MNVLIVVDMQNDFVTGALGSPEAVEIVPRVAQRVREGLEKGETVLFTRDTHGADYAGTQEGRKLPVAHCIKGSEGWEDHPAAPALRAPSHRQAHLRQSGPGSTFAGPG